MRVLPEAPPTLESLGVEDEIAAAWDRCRGLVLVTGVPGSGKSTLLAAGTRRLLERGAGRVQSYEAPIEFTFDGVGGGGALMSPSEVPRHFASFAEGVRSSLRRRPAAVVVGEARDRETVEGGGAGGGLRHRGVRDRAYGGGWRRRCAGCLRSSRPTSATSGGRRSST